MCATPHLPFRTSPTLGASQPIHHGPASMHGPVLDALAVWLPATWAVPEIAPARRRPHAACWADGLERCAAACAGPGWQDLRPASGELVVGVDDQRWWVWNQQTPADTYATPKSRMLCTLCVREIAREQYQPTAPARSLPDAQDEAKKNSRSRTFWHGSSAWLD